MPAINCELPAVFQEALWTTHGIPTLIEWAATEVYPWCIVDEELLQVLRSIWDLLYAKEWSLPDNSNHFALRIVSSISLA